MSPQVPAVVCQLCIWSCW